MSRVVVITGAGTGLGRAIAQRLAADGETVVLLGRRLAKIEAVASEIGPQAAAIQCDVSSPQSVRTAFAAIQERFGRVDVLVNNAAVFQPFLIAEASDDQIAQTLGANMSGPIYCARSAIPLMGRGGHIVNVSSEVVTYEYYPFMTLYQASKAGLERFSLALSRELESSGIRVTAVRAGQMVDADMVWEVEPAQAARFAKAAAEAGLDLKGSPKSGFASPAEVIRNVINLPEDLTSEIVTLRARR